MTGHFNFNTGRHKRFTAKTKEDKEDMVKTITFQFSGFSGWDILHYILPERFQAKIIAKRLLNKTYKGINLDETPLVVRMPYASYQVVKFDGKKVELKQTGI